MQAWVILSAWTQCSKMQSKTQVIATWLHKIEMKWRVRLWNLDPTWACSSSSEGTGFIHGCLLELVYRMVCKMHLPCTNQGVKSMESKSPCHKQHKTWR